MSLGGRLISLFPYFHVGGVLGFLAMATASASAGLFFLAIGWIYVFPLVLFRVHNWFFPLKPGYTAFDKPQYSAWWGSYQIQSIFIAVPALENILMSLHLYSLWLRLWGSQVGRGVYWTPTVRVGDRSLLKIGDGVIFGHRVELVSHVIVQGKNSQSIFIRPVEVGDRVFVAAGSFLAPGSKIEAGLVLPLASAVRVNQHVKDVSEVQVLA